MRVSSRSFSNSILLSLGTSALLVLIVIVITGGFSIRIGFFRFSAHSSIAALLVTAAAWTLLAANGRSSLAASAMRLTAAVERFATAMAIVLAAATCGSAIAYGSYAAGGADSASYVSQAALLEHGQLIRTEPLALQVGWPEPEWSLSPLGYRPGVHAGEIVGTYPPGLPIVFALAHRTMGEFGPSIAVALFGFVAVIATYGIARLLHSRTAGLIAAALMASSPIVLLQSAVPMSDVPATAWWALALACALTRWRGMPLLAGMSTGFAVLTRPNLLPLALAVLFALFSEPAAADATPPRSRARTLLAYAAGGGPAAVMLAAIQAKAYGSPLASGYGSFSYFFSLSNVTANLHDYAVRVLIGDAPAIALLAIAAVLLSLARRRTAAIPLEMVSAGGRLDPSITRAVQLAAIAAGCALACYLPYGVFPDWSYLRFLMPSYPAVFAAIGALTAATLLRVAMPARGIATLLIVTLVCTLNIVGARRQYVFDVRQGDARYQIAGHYLASALPPTAVIIADQESTSAWLYTGLPVVRWELLDVDLDAAIARLRLLGRRPMLLVEDWEAAALRRRFPRSPTAQLDWRPRAEIGEPVHVRLYDPDDRLRGAATWPIDGIR